MNNKLKLILLKLIEQDGNISNIVKLGYQYSEIATCYSELINDNYIVPNESLAFILSKKGIDMKKEIEETLENDAKIKIEPYIEYRITKMDIFDVFLP